MDKLIGKVRHTLINLEAVIDDLPNDKFKGAANEIIDRFNDYGYIPDSWLRCANSMVEIGMEK